MIRYFPTGLKIEDYIPYTARAVLSGFQGVRVVAGDICFVEKGVQVPSALIRQEVYNTSPANIGDKSQPWYSGFLVEPAPEPAPKRRRRKRRIPVDNCEV